MISLLTLVRDLWTKQNISKSLYVLMGGSTFSCKLVDTEKKAVWNSASSVFLLLTAVTLLSLLEKRLIISPA